MDARFNTYNHDRIATVLEVQYSLAFLRYLEFRQVVYHDSARMLLFPSPSAPFPF